MFKKYFITEKVEKAEPAKVATKAVEKQKKITADFETELRKLYKIKSVIYTAFGVQIEFLKKPEKEEILSTVDANVKFKDKSIFIEF